MSNNENNPNMNDNYPFLEDERGEDKKISDNLKFCMIMLCMLAFLRIFALEFKCMLNDLVSAMIVYCTIKSRAKVMAIICLITAVLFWLNEIIVSPIELNKISSTSNTGVISSKDNNIYQKPKETNNEKSSSNSVNFIYCMMLFNMILGILIYSSMIYLSYKAYEIYRTPWGKINQDNLMNPFQEENNYEAIEPNNKNYISGFVNNQRNNNNNQLLMF